MVRDGRVPRHGYYQNITICGNRFVECRKPMLFAVSTGHVRLCGNLIEDGNNEISLLASDDIVDVDRTSRQWHVVAETKK